MPIIKSAIKRAKQTIVRRSRNLQVKRAVKLDITELYAAIAEGGEVNAKLAAAYSEIDRAVKKGTLHKNTAGRKKSQLATAVAKAAAAAAEPKVEAEPKKPATAKKTAAKTVAKAPAKKPAAKPAAKAAPKKPAAKPAKKAE
jgi:ribosomal protein S20